MILQRAMIQVIRTRIVGKIVLSDPDPKTGNELIQSSPVRDFLPVFFLDLLQIHGSLGRKPLPLGYYLSDEALYMTFYRIHIFLC